MAAAEHKVRIKDLVRQVMPCTPLTGDLGKADLAVLERYADPRALLRLGRTREAAVEIEASLAAPQPVDDRGLWEGTVGLSAAEDSNPHLLADTLSVPEPGRGGKVIRGEESDGLARAGLWLGIYPFHARQGPLSSNSVR